MTEQPTLEQVSEMLKAVVLGDETALADEFPDTWAQLQDQVDEIEAAGLVVDGFAL
jgi:hypothetical protein